MNQAHLDMGELHVITFGQRMTWLDTGTLVGLLKAAELVETIQERKVFYVSCIEEIAWRRGFIDAAQLRSMGRKSK